MHWNIVAILIWRFFVPHIFQLQQEKYDNVVFWYKAKNISSAKKSSRLPLQNKKYQLIHWVTNLKQEKKNSLISIVLDSVWILTPFSLPCKSRGKDERKKKVSVPTAKKTYIFLRQIFEPPEENQFWSFCFVRLPHSPYIHFAANLLQLTTIICSFSEYHVIHVFRTLIKKIPSEKNHGSSLVDWTPLDIYTEKC